MKLTLWMTLACVVLAGSLHGQKLTGQTAPAFTMGGVVNPYGPVDSAQMAGDVIVIKVWGID